MTNSIKLMGAVLLSTFLFSSCQEDCDTTVTQVSEDEAGWLVYSRGDSAYFINETNQQVNFVNTALLSEQVPGEGFSTTSDCIEQYDVQAFSSIEDPQNKYPGLATYILKKPDTLQVVIVVEERGEFEINEAQPTYATLTINNVAYSNVFEIVKTDSTKTTNLKRLRFNKQFGFLSAEYYDGKKLQLMQ
ncbi:hypothetical protein OB13_02385 [Pontibacter sp. HJ8]